MAGSLQPAGASVDAQASGKPASGQSLPLRQRRWDIVFIAFFLLNLCFVTYVVDIEQVIIADPSHFQYPIWPPHALVDLFHSYGNTIDPLINARPTWWKATIWIDELLFGPFYAVAIFAFIKGKNWIRLPSIIWASVMMTNVTIILSEEFFGPHATPHPVLVFLSNLAWLVFPILVMIRMWRSEKPFSPRESSGTKEVLASG
jgi:hypothetical protein